MTTNNPEEINEYASRIAECGKAVENLRQTIMDNKDYIMDGDGSEVSLDEIRSGLSKKMHECVHRDRS